MKKFILERCGLCILLIGLMCLLINIPIYLYPVLKFIDSSNDSINLSEMSFNSIFYSQALFVKVIPCCLLVTFISLLIKQLIEIKRNSKRLQKSKRTQNTGSRKTSAAPSLISAKSRSKLSSRASSFKNIHTFEDTANANIVKQIRKSRRNIENFRATVMLVNIYLIFAYL